MGKVVVFMSRNKNRIFDREVRQSLVDQAIQLRKSGSTYAAIAQTIGVHTSTVCQWCKSYAAENSDEAQSEKSCPKPDLEQTSHPKQDRGGLKRAARELSRQRMIEAAIQLLIENGTEKTTLKDIGEKAGYSRGLANSQFSGKDKLFREVVRFAYRRWLEALRPMVKGRRGLDALLASTECVCHFIENATDTFIAMYMLWFESIGSRSEGMEELRAIHRAARSDIRRWVDQGIAAGEIRADVEPDRFAEQHTAFIYGIVYQWLVNMSDVDPRTAFTSYVKNMKRLIATDPGSAGTE